MVREYAKKPVVIRAVQFTRDNFEEIQEFTHGLAKGFTIERCLNGKRWCTIPTLEGDHTALEGDFIIEGVKGEFYPCKPDIFKQTYETVSMVSDNDRTTVLMSQYIKLENKNKKLRNTINRLKRVIEKQEDELL